MRKIVVCGGAMLLALSQFLLIPQIQGHGTAEAASLRTADRELKMNKEPYVTDVYERAHRIIWDGKKAQDDRVRIAVVIHGDENIVVEDRVKNQIYSQLRKKFPRENFAVMKGVDINTRLLQYAEDAYYENRGTLKIKAKIKPDGAIKEKQVIITDQLDVDGVAVRAGEQPRGLSDIRRNDLVRMGRDLGYNYVFMLSLSNGYARNTLNLLGTTQRKNVWVRVRLVDVNSGSYLYRNDIAAEGKTHNGGINGRVIERSVKKAMQEAMDDIAIDY